MNSSTLEHRQITKPVVAAKPAAEQRSRVDLYRMIHKTLRKVMFETVYRLGRADVDEANDLDQALNGLGTLLEFCESHLNKENAYVHLAMESRVLGSTGYILNEHFEHLEAIEDLRQGIDLVRNANASERHAAMHYLYLEATEFVGENLIHMRYEEKEHNAVLWAAYSDEELLEIEQRIIASVEPPELMGIMEHAIPAQTHAERVGMLCGMKQSGMPVPAFEAMLQLARDTLDSRDLGKLAKAIGVPAVPGLVEAW
jgi:hypothetical protein